MKLQNKTDDELDAAIAKGEKVIAKGVQSMRKHRAKLAFVATAGHAPGDVVGHVAATTSAITIGLMALAEMNTERLRRDHETPTT